MGKILVNCDWCHKELLRYQCNLGKHIFCCSSCRSKFLSKEHNPDGYIKHPHLTGLNVVLNPERMTPETRSKLRAAHLGSGEGKAYEKTFSRHTHRVVAEEILGRKLLPGEVVHNIDGNRRNNCPKNLMVFPSQNAHAAWHARWNAIIKSWVPEEVVPA